MTSLAADGPGILTDSGSRKDAHGAGTTKGPLAVIGGSMSAIDTGAGSKSLGTGPPWPDRSDGRSRGPLGADAT